MKILVVLASVCLSLSLWAVEHQSDAGKDYSKQLKDTQQKVEEMLKNKNLTPEKRFFIYILAAKKIRTYQEWAVAEDYYKKALAQKAEYNENRFRAMTELGFVFYHQKKYSDLLKLSLEMDSFAKDRKIYDKDKNFVKSQLFLNYLGSQKPCKEAISKEIDYFKDSPFFEFVLNEDLKLQMQDGNYEIAWGLISRTDFTKNEHNLLAVYDLLQLINNQPTKKRLCLDQAKEYQNNPATPLRICRMVTQAIGKQLKKDEVLRLIEQIEKEKSGHQFMIPALKKLADTFSV